MASPTTGTRTNRVTVAAGKIHTCKSSIVKNSSKYSMVMMMMPMMMKIATAVMMIMMMMVIITITSMSTEGVIGHPALQT